MKVRITFEAGDCVEPEMIGRTFENSVEKNVSCGVCKRCAFNIMETTASDPFETACIAACGCRGGAFVEVTDGQTKEVTK